MWRSRIFWQLFGAYSLLLALALGLLGWTVARRVEDHLLIEIRQSLLSKTVLVRELVAARELSEEAERKWIDYLSNESNLRITLIAADGRVLADSHEDPGRMENHGARPEILEARDSGTGSATRFSTTVHQPMMYVARRTDLGPVAFVRLALPLGAVDAELRWLQQLVWTAAGVTLIFAMFLSLLLARRMSAPLVALAEASRSVASGAYGQRVDVARRDEIGVLAAAFNEMSEACASHIARMEQDREQLRAIFRGMVEGVLVLDSDQHIQFMNEAAGRLLDITPAAAAGRKLWEVARHHQLGKAVEKIFELDEPFRCELEWGTNERRVLAVHGNRLPLQAHAGRDNGNAGGRRAVLVLHDITHLRKLERMRQDFVANVSHELKTPLATIQATVETLLDGAVNDPEHNLRFLESIRDSSERLHRLVLDLLTLGRIESGQETMELQPIAVQSAVDACIGRLESRAAAKELELRQEPPPASVLVRADEEALGDLLDNLVDNAIKYTHRGGRVTIRWFADGNEAVLQVVDTGIGIPEKDLPRVFERFYRVDKARSRELGGTGLGLSIVKHLAQAMAGGVEAKSTLGAGSTFTVRLPLAVGK